MGRFFESQAEPNLGVFRESLEGLLDVYYKFTERRIGFGDFRNFSFTPEKGYTARTIVPVAFDGERVGDLYVLLFKPGDGTGDESTYKLSDVDARAVTPQLDKRPGKEVVPRKKHCPTEIFFPFGSAFEDQMHEGVVNLELLTLDRRKFVKKEYDLGLNYKTFIELLRSKQLIGPYVQFTTGYHQADNRRFGDPHSVYFPPLTAGVVQMVGFLEMDFETEMFKLFKALAFKGPQMPALPSIQTSKLN